MEVWVDTSPLQLEDAGFVINFDDTLLSFLSGSINTSLWDFANAQFDPQIVGDLNSDVQPNDIGGNGQRLGMSVNGNYLLATLNFQATASTGSSPLTFLTTPVAYTDVIEWGGSALFPNITLENGIVNIVPGTATPTLTASPTPVASLTPTASPSPTVSPTPTVACPPPGSCLGDADRSGFIDVDDFASVQFNFGVPAGPPVYLGDADCSDFVDVDDFAAVQFNFGVPCP